MAECRLCAGQGHWITLRYARQALNLTDKEISALPTLLGGGAERHFVGAGATHGSPNITRRQQMLKTEFLHGLQSIYHWRTCGIAAAREGFKSHERNLNQTARICWYSCAGIVTPR